MFALQLLDGGLYCLETSVEGTRVDTEWLRVKVRPGNVRGKFVRLSHAMRGQCWVGWVARWRRELGLVCAGAEIDRPVETVLGVS